MNSKIFKLPLHMDNKDRFQLYLNGKEYGGGYNWYMIELISDWLVNKDLYGEDEVEFTIKRTHKTNK